MFVDKLRLRAIENYETSISDQMKCLTDVMVRASQLPADCTLSANTSLKVIPEEAWCGLDDGGKIKHFRSGKSVDGKVTLMRCRSQKRHEFLRVWMPDG